MAAGMPLEGGYGLKHYNIADGLMPLSLTLGQRN
jgi:hypothetical protein